jgi:hypothetical protein
MNNLMFEQIKWTGKTKKYNVFNFSEEFLGTIHWRPGWRCYVISYADGIDMSLSCNKEVNDFMEKLEKERMDNLIKNIKGKNGK